MKHYNRVIQSSTAPSSDDLWLDNGVLKHLRNGIWAPIGQSEIEDRRELEEKVDSLDKEVGDIHNALSQLGSSQGVVALQIGNSAEVKAANLAALQAVQTTDHTFLADINYGYGTGSWLPTTGGNATIFTDEGHAVFYTISADAAITKTSEMTLGVKATTSADGLMSKEDKTKLDSLIQIPSGGSTGQVLKKTATGVAWQADNDTKYTLPAATATALGGVKTVAIPTALAEEAELADVVAKVNSSISSLTSSGVFK